jgi:hypothetical protein
MKTDLKVELFLIHQTYFTDNHGNTSGHPQSWINQIRGNTPFDIRAGIHINQLFSIKKPVFLGMDLT